MTAKRPTATDPSYSKEMEHAMPQTDDDKVYFNDGSDRYLDWSVHHDNGCDLEIGQGHDGANIELSWPEFERIAQAMLLTLNKRRAQLRPAIRSLCR